MSNLCVETCVNAQRTTQVYRNSNEIIYERVSPAAQICHVRVRVE